MMTSFVLGLYMPILIGALPPVSLSSSFSLTYHTSGGLPNTPNPAGEVCYQEESVIIDPNGLSRIMSCSAMSTDSPDSIINQVHVGIESIQLSSVIGLLNDLILAGSTSPVGNDTSCPDDWHVSFAIQTPLYQRAFSFPRHHRKLSLPLSQFVETLEKFLEDNAEMPDRRVEP